MVAMNDIVKKWADDGVAESTLRPGKVNVGLGSPDDYRPLMKQL